jgi:uncharacterized protein
MFVVDTNILIYAANTSCQEHACCRELVESWRYQVEPWFITWNIIYEFLRIVTHPKVFRNPWQSKNAWTFIDSLLVSPGLTLLEHSQRHPQVARLTISELPVLKGNLIHDSHTAILMREHGIRRIYTHDADFYRFPFIEVIDPLNQVPPK